MQENHTLSDDLTGRLLKAFGLNETIDPDLDGLRQVYAAWCRSVPFDNIRKMISLRSGPDVQLAGLDAEEFLENWLANGSGGTCWPSSNALYAILTKLGFDARRAAGSMFDLGIINHGTVKVRIDGVDWLCDSSMLTKTPLPLTGEIYISSDPTVGVEVEPVGDSYIIWIDFVPLPDYVPCRLLQDPADDELYRERYEVFSREASPFNERLYYRKSGPSGASTVMGNTRFARTSDGLDVREFSREALCEYLTESAGVSPHLVEKWVSSGSLDSTFEPQSELARPEILGRPPSRR